MPLPALIAGQIALTGLSMAPSMIPGCAHFVPIEDEEQPAQAEAHEESSGLAPGEREA